MVTEKRRRVILFLSDSRSVDDQYVPSSGYERLQRPLDRACALCVSALHPVHFSEAVGSWRRDLGNPTAQRTSKGEREQY